MKRVQERHPWWSPDTVIDMSIPQLLFHLTPASAPKLRDNRVSRSVSLSEFRALQARKAGQ